MIIQIIELIPVYLKDTTEAIKSKPEVKDCVKNTKSLKRSLPELGALPHIELKICSEKHFY